MEKHTFGCKTFEILLSVCCFCFYMFDCIHTVVHILFYRIYVRTGAHSVCISCLNVLFTIQLLNYNVFLCVAVFMGVETLSVSLHPSFIAKARGHMWMHSLKILEEMWGLPNSLNHSPWKIRFIWREMMWRNYVFFFSVRGWDKI